MVEAVMDVVVVIPGITGSTLVQRRGDRLVPVWAPSAGAVVNAVRSLGGSVRGLRLDRTPDDGPADDGIEPAGLVPDLHVIPGVWTANLGYSAIMSWLSSTFHVFEYDPKVPLADQHPVPNLVRFPYDWRLSNRYNALRLQQTVEPVLRAWQAQGEPYRQARLVLVCHSMGGLIARWYAEQLGGAEQVRAIVTVGTPHRGSLNALDSIVNGVRKGIGPLALDLTAAVRSFPSMYELLPAFQCVADSDGLIAPHQATLPNLDAQRARWAREQFHDRLHRNPTQDTAGYNLHTIVGIRQPTRATAVLDGQRLSFSDLIDGDDLGGDGTVSRLAATPPGVQLDGPTVHGVSEQHGFLQHHKHTFEQLYTALTGAKRVYLDGAANAARLGVRVDALHLTDEPITVAVTSSTDAVRLRATLTDEAGRPVASALLKREDRARFTASFAPPPEGGYRITVDRDGPSANPVRPVNAATLVWDADKMDPEAGRDG
ncbi:hypothetical protein Val02_85350 [Virgisporangium aliadipatigenens]|uniref:Lecithin:cholesterol acyltransferase n=1 Tax=Virgisporangium aliadipatigenens TaxID=741659 RepID=A0A8J3YTM0_9ACTN|nr:alpha/beta fold hydrolase [Virgisporangium aliadipatigenens]GIJ51649.1 hypothetical protein Val02_85350 [Virgisporangium aliadipatigenens]